MFYVELTDSGNNVIATNLSLIPQRYSGAAVGGYEQSEIRVEGEAVLLREVHRWLGAGVRIINERRNVVWAGKIMQTTTSRGKRKLIKSLDDMFNRIAVAYSYDDATGASQRGTTSYADDTNSQYLYGIKEQLQSIGDMDSTAADSLRDKALVEKANPVKVITLDGDGQQATGTLVCRGRWSTLGWQLWNQPGGVEKFDVNGNYEHLLGWGKTSTGIGFESGKDGIHDINGGLAALRKDDLVIVSGATNGGNNGTFTIEQATSNDASQYTASSIYFEVTDDIKDSVGGLGFVQSTQLLAVSGSSVSGNNRWYFSKDDLAADHITVNPATVANSGAGPSITIAQGHSVITTGSLTQEYPGANVTIKALGTIVAQAFTLSVNSPFTVAEVFLRVKKVGSPSDNLQCFIEADSSGSPSNVSLESATVAGSAITTDMNWVKFTFTNTLALSYGTTYWVVLWRTGANSTTDYYMVDLAEDSNGTTNATYTAGQCKLYNGSAWVTRANNTDMPFQIWSKRETTTQINDILTSKGQFFAALDIQNASGIYSRQFRDQDQTAQAEIETLLKAGVSGGRRLLASVTADGVAHIFQEPTYNADSAPVLNDDNNLMDSGGVAPWEPGKLPFGMWITLANELPDDSSIFIERAEYDAVNNNYAALEPKGAPNVWDVVSLP